MNKMTIRDLCHEYKGGWHRMSNDIRNTEEAV